MSQWRNRNKLLERYDQGQSNNGGGGQVVTPLGKIIGFQSMYSMINTKWFSVSPTKNDFIWFVSSQDRWISYCNSVYRYSPRKNRFNFYTVLDNKKNWYRTRFNFILSGLATLTQTYENIRLQSFFQVGKIEFWNRPIITIFLTVTFCRRTIGSLDMSLSSRLFVQVVYLTWLT